jgi:preprotein translocase subunit SecD
LRVGRYFLALLGLVIALYSLIVFPGQRHTPKLGIDLVGGIRVVFTALTPKGAPPPTSSQMSQARQIMEDRINTYGVTGATVVVQGSDQLVIEIPSGTGADVNRLGTAATLNFRGVIAPAQPITCSNAPAKPTGTASATSGGTGSQTATQSASSSASSSPTQSSTSKSTNDQAHHRLAPSTSAKSSPSSKPTKPAASGSATGSATPSSSSSPTVAKCLADPFATIIRAQSTDKDRQAMRTLLTQSTTNLNALNAETCPSPSMPSVNGTKVPCHGYQQLTATQQQEILLALRNYDCNAAEAELDAPHSFYIACDPTHTVAYLLGHIVVKGTSIKSATAQAPNVGAVGGSTEWTVRLTLNGSGANSWHDWTSKYHTDQSGSPVQTSSTAPCGAGAALPCSDWVAFTLDGNVLSSPITQGVLDVNTEIRGGFTQSSANALARELNYGKLTVTFRAEENNKVSATLGSSQLRAAFTAGGIGLALVVLYSLLYYRALGLVTIASLLVSGTLTYAMLVILSSQIGFTLDLAGIAGFIVALGITADSFVVFFERMKDEVHEGRSLRVAVPRAWVRARRTILSADTVSFLAAAILYYFASADVKGFAFTLGMSTILDLVVVFLFTHPMVSLLSRSKAFGSPRFTGLASVREGGIATYDETAVPAARRSRRLRRGAAERDEASAVAVLDETDEADEGVEEAAAAAPAPRPESATEADHPRRHTTPEPGTAAERAAARRARMREQGDGKEKR